MPRRKNQKGFILVTLAGAAMMAIIFLNAFISLYRYRAGQLAQRWSNFAAQETALSGIAVLEAALRRRMWEVPPDSNCLRAESFGVEGETSSGVQYAVDATFDNTTRVVNFTARSNYFGRGVSIQKNLRVMDISDFLIFSKSPNVSVLTGVQGQTNNRFASGLVGRERRLYFEGPVQLSGFITRSWLLNDPAGRPVNFGSWNAHPHSVFRPEQHINHLIQGERIYMLGGLQTKELYVPYPNTEAVNDQPGGRQAFLDSLNTGARIWQEYPHAYFTGSFPNATAMISSIENWNSGTLPANTIQGIYPRALFGRGLSFPLNATTATDSGNFLNNPNFWAHFAFKYGPGFNHGGDFTCFTDPAISGNKHCSNSNDFPNGFNQWRTQAGLDGVLIGGEGTKLDFTKIDWDNMEALEEEATECGLVVDPSDSGSYDGSHEDCDISNTNTIQAYKDSPSSNPCETVLDLDLDNLGTKLQNFDPSVYPTTNPGRVLRRVVYVKGRTQVAQDQASGIWPALNHPITRSNMPIWFIAEREMMVKPFQPDTTSPLNVNPTVKRIGYFNEDPAATLPPLSFVFLTPEQITLLSPTHIPTTFPEMQDMLPIDGSGKIRPRRTVITDFVHQEEDAYKFGFRDIRMSNIALITNANSSSYAAGFFFRGLWGVRNTLYDAIYRACWMDYPGDAIGRDAKYENAIPPWANHVAFPDRWIPPTGSKFYNDPDSDGIDNRPQGHEMDRNTPYVFHLQRANGVAQPQLVFSGLRVVADFDSAAPPSKYDLNVPRYPHSDGNVNPTSAAALISTAGRRYRWSEQQHTGTTENFLDTVETGLCRTRSGTVIACDPGVCENIPTGGGGPANIHHADGTETYPPVIFYTNFSERGVDFRQVSPDYSYNNLGAITHTALPTTFLRDELPPWEINP